MIPKTPDHKRIKDGVFRDKRWLKAIASQEIPCALTGRYGCHGDQVVPMHIGTAGKAVKSPDNEVLPALDSLHKRSHGQDKAIGFHTMMLEVLKNDKHLLLDMVRAYAREHYRS
jgi:hypothetical protein